MVMLMRREKSDNNSENIIKSIIKNYYTTNIDKNIQCDIEKFYSSASHEHFNTSRSIRENLNELAMKYYPNEAIIRSQFIKHVLSKTNNQTTIIELPILSSRCDIAKFNHLSIGYEIKTEFDTPVRLESQLSNYCKIFEKVYIIIPESHYKKYKILISNQIGVYTYKLRNGRYFFKCCSKAIKNTVLPLEQLNQMTIRFLNTTFNKTNLDRNHLTNYILENYTSTYINSVFKKYYKQKYKSKWEFIESNIDNIYGLDLDWFFKTNIKPDLFYKSRESLS